MNVNKWTVGLAAAGLVSLASVAQAQEAKETVKTLVASTTVSGYVSASYIWSPGVTQARADLAHNDESTKNDGISLDVVSLTFASAKGDGEWAAGYKVQAWVGPDASSLGTSSVGTDLSIKNAYIDLRAPIGSGLGIKVGVFDLPFGMEGSDRTGNAHYSHSLGYGLEPTQLTGVQLDYKVSDAVSVTAGIANSTSALINSSGASGSDRNTYFGAITFKAPDSLGMLKGTEVTAGIINGEASGSAVNLSNYYVGIALPTFVTNLKLGVALDFKQNAGADDQITGIYAAYKVSDKLTANLRAEFGEITSVDKESYTATLRYAMWANVLSQLEYRLDTNSGANSTANTVIANLIYSF